MGCGCLPLIAVFLLGSLFLSFAEEATGSIPGAEAFGPALVGIVLAWVLVGAFRRARRQAQERDAASDGAPTPTERSPGGQVASPPSPGPTFEERERARMALRTEPDAPEVIALKKRLAEAVTDLSETVEGMPATVGDGLLGVSSDEMIARAKERIAHWDKSANES